MAKLAKSGGERASIHEMLKEPSPSAENSAASSPTLDVCPNYPYSLSPSSDAKSPAILTPTSPCRSDDDDSNSLTKTSGASRIDHIKNWSISTFKCTKQIMYEMMGKSSRTVDSELETQIKVLRDTQQKYQNVLRLARVLSFNFYHVVQTQHALGEAFSELAQKSPELQEEFLYNCETQRSLTKNGETLLGALQFFTSSVGTLCYKTIEDCLQSVRQYEMARLKYDAYRMDLEGLAHGPRSDTASPGFEEAQKNFELHKQNFMKLRTEVAIKMKFLDENRVKVMQKQLLLFHNAISAYFSGNQTALEATLSQFNIKIKSPNSTFPSWLEQ